MLSEVFIAGDHLPSDGAGFFDTEGFTPSDTQENQFLLSPQEPVFSFSGSDDSTPKTNSSDDATVMDERKRRRMISNRESARRSRMRKQKHLENLRNQMNRLKTNNREVANRLRVVNLHGKLVREENQRLRSESVMLQQKLWDIRQVLLVRQLHHQLLPSAWPCNNNVTSIYEQYPPSLIT
ncbi:basic leucine zipper 4 [Lactuca sativa]|uniref:basic leucine zipper 4 n=1 Tax=Lactuca sativa TaxID=4236 RepID=UPI000CC99F14|nr:basic leucine zipper 4 [Lactuca sativa]